MAKTISDSATKATDMSASLKSRGWAELPEHVLQYVFQLLPPDSLIAASRACRSWQAVCFYSGSISRRILTPLLPLLRDRFGAENLPTNLSVAELRKLLVLYNRQDGLGKFCSTAFYDISALIVSLDSSSDRLSSSPKIPSILRQAVLSSDLLGILVKPRRILLFDTSTSPVRYLTAHKARDLITAFSLSGPYLIVVTRTGNLDIQQLIGRTTRSPSLYREYCIPIPSDPDSGIPVSVAATPSVTGVPLVAVLTTKQVWLVHRSHVITLRRENDFFREEALSGDYRNVAKMSEKQAGKMPAPQLSMRTKERREREPWLLRADIELSEIIPVHDITASISPIKFMLHSQQLQIGSFSVFLGTHVLDPTIKTTPDSLFSFFARPNNWKVQIFPPLPSDGLYNGHHVSPRDVAPFSEIEVSAKTNKNSTNYIYTHFIHLHAEYYIVTCTPSWRTSSALPNFQDTSKTNHTNFTTTTNPISPSDVRIISLSPITNRITTKLILFRLPTSSELIVPRYAAHRPQGGGPKSGYLAFMPAMGRLDLLPIALIPFEEDHYGSDINSPGRTSSIKSVGGFSYFHSDSLESEPPIDRVSVAESSRRRRTMEIAGERMRDGPSGGTSSGQHVFSFGGPEERGWELVQQCKDVSIGHGLGELVEITAGKERVVVLGSEGMAVVKLFDDDGGVGGETTTQRGERSSYNSGGSGSRRTVGDGNWWIDQRGRVKAGL